MVVRHVSRSARDVVDHSCGDILCAMIGSRELAKFYLDSTDG